MIMQQSGLPVSTFQYRKISDALAVDEEPTRSDVRGLDDWMILTRSSVGLNGYSEAVTTARALALQENRPHAAVLQFRSGALGAGHLVLMELADWSDLVAEARSTRTRFAETDSTVIHSHEDSGLA